MGIQEEKKRTDDYPQLKLEGQLCFPLYAAARKIVNVYNPLLKQIGLTYTQYIVLLALWEYGKTTVGELCRALYLDCGTLTPLLKKMEENGWVVRTRSKGDERVVNVSVTDAGWKMREQVKELPEQVGGCIAMPREDLYTLYTLLRRLLETVE